MLAALVARSARFRERFLLADVLVVATCALVYELLAATVGSYLLGDATRSFALVVGVYLASLGVGSTLSGLVDRNRSRSSPASIVFAFVVVELVLAVVGGLSVPALFLVFAHIRHFSIVLLAHVALVGTLVGVELPLLTRLLRAASSDRESTHTANDASSAVARAFAADHLGSLVGALLFPLLLVPFLGLVRAALLVGAINALVAVAAAIVLRPRFHASLAIVGVIVASALGIACARGRSLERLVDDTSVSLSPSPVEGVGAGG